MTYITAATTYSIGKAYGLLVTVNTALTGTLTIADGGTTVAVITNPTVGTMYRYFGFNGTITVVNNATADVTVSLLNHQA